MTIQEFFIKWNNQKIDFDKHYGSTCVDLYRQYCQEVLLFPQSPPVTGAADIWNTYRQDLFIKIPNTPLGIPQLGDIVIWSKTLGGYGHVAIFQSGNLWNLTCFSQNWPVGSPCHFQKTGYRYVLGWLRPKAAIPVPALPKVPLDIARIGVNLGLADGFRQKVKEYSSGKISFNLNDYRAVSDFDHISGLTQDQTYALVDRIKPKEKFVFIFFKPIPGQSYYFYTSYSYPKGDCCITTCPGEDPRALAFELSHQLQKFYNDHRGNKPPVEVIDEPGASGPTDQLIKNKYDSVSAFYQ